MKSNSKADISIKSLAIMIVSAVAIGLFIYIIVWTRLSNVLSPK